MTTLKIAIINALVWMFTYLYIRRYLNPENNGNVKKYYLDTLFGGLATFIGVFLTAYLTKTF
jgi:hypothetical protein